MTNWWIDPKTIERWRNETYRGLKEELRLKRLEETIIMPSISMLTEILSKIHGEQCIEICDLEGLNSIFADFLAFQDCIKQVPRIFDFEYFIDGSKETATYYLRAQQIEHFILIDASTGMLVSNSKTIIPSDDGRVGEVVATIFPELRYRNGDGMWQTVSKATLLIKFDHPIDRTKRRV